MGEFKLRLNDIHYDVVFRPGSTEPGTIYQQEETSTRHLTTMDDLKATLSALYGVLDVDEFKLKRENLLVRRLEELRVELRPMELVMYHSTLITHS